MSKLFKPPEEGFSVPEKFKRTQKYLVHKINGFLMFSSGIKKKHKRFVRNGTTHFWQVFLCHTLWKHQKTLVFPEVLK